MGYSTMYEGSPGMDQYDKLKLHIASARASGKDVYILAISSESASIEDIKTRLNSGEIKRIVPVNGTIDFIVAGSENEAKNVAKYLFENTGQNVGAVRYSQKDMLSLYLEIQSAIRTAREQSKPWHFYKPEQDSLAAVIDGLK